MKIKLFSYDTRFLFTPPFTMIVAAPEGSPPRRISNKQFKKTLPAVPRTGPEVGFYRIHYVFYSSGVNPIDSCLFLQSQFFNTRKFPLPCLQPDFRTFIKMLIDDTGTDAPASSSAYRFGDLTAWDRTDCHRSQKISCQKMKQLSSHRILYLFFVFLHLNHCFSWLFNGDSPKK